MKMLSMLAMILLSFNILADNVSELKYDCAINKSEHLKVYEISSEENGSREISLAIDHFLYGENEVARLKNPNIIHYGEVMMISEYYGRSGYIFLRFEDNRPSADNGYGDVLGMIDDNRFLPHHNLGYAQGHLSVLANCKRVN
ncbi:MAG: hypothetical protein L6Q33_07120 [Bacteriovoracaceae bacterium]|nr:hypothetical protein [Bacteriovoracaceae bacterium]